MYENYCKIRDYRGFKDSDVAFATGITKSTFSDWKSGRSTPKFDKLEKIASYLGVTLEELKYGDIDWDPKTQEIVQTDYYIDEKTSEYAEFLKNHPEYSVLFDAVQKVKSEDINKSLKAIGIFIDED